MKKYLFTFFVAFIALTLKAENKTVTFTVTPQLVCNNCETKVKDNLRFEKGIKSVKPSAKKGTVEVTYDDNKTDIDAIKQGFKKIGYEALPKDFPEEAQVCPEQGCEETIIECSGYNSNQPSCCGGN